MQQSQHSWVLFLLKLPQQACLLSCSQLRAAGLTLHLFVLQTSQQLPLTQTQFPKLELGANPTIYPLPKPPIFPLPNQSGQSLKAHLCQDHNEIVKSFIFQMNNKLKQEIFLLILHPFPKGCLRVSLLSEKEGIKPGERRV